MRRGHPGIGGWRNENNRHFRPRNDGLPRFRPPRMYSLLDGPRFPPPGPRLHRGPRPYNTHSLHSDELPDHQERNTYRNQTQHHRLPKRGHQQRSRQPYPYNHPNSKQDDNCQYKHSYYKEPPETYHVNSLGDVDQRQINSLPQTHRINPWANSLQGQTPFSEERIQHQYPRHHSEGQDPAEGNTIPSISYTGHRPPSSDYYGSTSSATGSNNDTSFSRSVDDTVDIVRKRLSNRSEPQSITQNISLDRDKEQDIGMMSYQQNPQEPPTKRKIQKQRQNIKSNCDKMKTNIVHQLFKMDKDKMHKLMDDPGSSSKFEYAISSLITESQNSLNRHLRSVAEKSLNSSSSDFIHNDSNTIYEDTFMKQMQCILDPQDTVLLEDIKPLVLAELSKVLQLNESDLRYDIDHVNTQLAAKEELMYPNYDHYNYDEHPQGNIYDEDLRVLPNYEGCTTDLTEYNENNQSLISEQDYQDPIFERSSSINHEYNQDRRQSIDSQKQRRSTDTSLGEQFCAKNETLPLFDTNCEQFSEDEDTFAELDRQYHVAVDHNFLDDVSARTTPTYVQTAEQVNSTNVRKDIDIRLESLNKSPITVQSKDKNLPTFIKQEVLQSPDFPKENSTPANSENIAHSIESTNINDDHPDCKDREEEACRSDNLIKGKTSQSNGRKRSIDQRPSHRKEKRKKSDTSRTESVYTISHKHDRSKEKYNDTPRCHNVFTSTVSTNKLAHYKRRNNTDKNYSEKYVKRKEPQSKKRETHRNRISSSSNQTILSLKNSNNSSGSTTKSDSKNKFKTIDMFMEQTKKVTVHQAHRNTASNVVVTPKVAEENSIEMITSPTKLTYSTHASTQVFRRVINKETQTFESKNATSRYIQTEKSKLVSKGNQTSQALLDKPKPKAKDAFERMKEIDMEIQSLLQEKFKLYHNLESRDSCSISENLGMTVLNVTAFDDNATQNVVSEEVSEQKTPNPNTEPGDNMSADAIIDDFTNIPVEELEQIALESVAVPKTKKSYTRQKKLQKERLNSASPSSSTSSRQSRQKKKTPIISLIEQIITDDRPLEDIISLDALESPPKQKKTPKSKLNKRATKKSKPFKSIDTSPYNLKQCSVVLVRMDFAECLKREIPGIKDATGIDNVVTIDSFETINEPVLLNNQTLVDYEVTLGSNYMNPSTHPDTENIVEESVVSDMQFDMLDVSEDIVIGESCEIKDKDLGENTITISEDLILDNSQISIDNAMSTEIPQVENECRTYDYSTDEDLRRDSLTVTGNADAVLAIECIENGFLAACLDGNVYHFSSDGQLLNTMRGSNLAVTCLTIVKEKYGTTVYTGSLDSRIRYYELETGLEKGPECNVLSPIQTMDRAWDTVFVGTRTGFVLQFECKNNMLIPVSTVKFSEQAILALRAMKEGPRKVLLVASRSENVTVKDAQTGLLLRTLSGPKMTVYTLLFEDGKVYCGTSSHQIHVFDYATGIHSNSHEGGKGAVCLRATGGLLFAGCYDGCVYVYREGETRPLAQLRGPSLMLLSLAIVGSKIIAGYKDRSLYIWKIPLSILQEMIL